MKGLLSFVFSWFAGLYARALGMFSSRVARSAALVALLGLLSECWAQAQTDATAIATTAGTDFAIIAPITITIVTFYVVLKLAKRTVK
jgi:hypothetical protein